MTCATNRTVPDTPRGCTTGRSAEGLTTTMRSSVNWLSGFDGWISIEDGVEGIDQLRESVEFLRRKISAYWPADKK